MLEPPKDSRFGRPGLSRRCRSQRCHTHSPLLGRRPLVARTRKSMHAFLERINVSPLPTQRNLLSWNLAPKASFLFPVPLGPQHLRVISHIIPHSRPPALTPSPHPRPTDISFGTGRVHTYNPLLLPPASCREHPIVSLLPAPPSLLPRSLGPSHLATATAEPIAAHGVVSQGAFLAAVATRPAALLRVAERRASPYPRSSPRSTLPSQPGPTPGTTRTRSPEPNRSRTPPPPPRSRSRTREGPGAGGGGDVGSLAGTLPTLASRFSPPWYLEGLVEQAAPASLLQKLVVFIDATARELAGQVEPGQATGLCCWGNPPALPRESWLPLQGG